MYVKVTNGVVEKVEYTIGQLRKDNPGTSFPKTPSNATLAEWGMFPLKQTPAPSVDHTKNVTKKLPVKKGNEWVQEWEVTNASPEEIAERENGWANNVRAERDQKLIESDWTQIADVPVDKEAWAAYRQDLRDIPKQPGFPQGVIWPQKPE